LKGFRSFSSRMTLRLYTVECESPHILGRQGTDESHTISHRHIAQPLNCDVN
jgi:hypothetical protein